jgi:histidine ammonia-lyase
MSTLCASISSAVFEPLSNVPSDVARMVAIAGGASVGPVPEEAMRAMVRSRGVVEACVGDGLAHYGINTGFGSLSRQRVGREQLRELQRNLIRSHAAGVGSPMPTRVVRGMMALLAGSLARGNSGVRPVVVQTLHAMLDNNVVPIVPEIGSVGASGDLAPLAALGLAMMGEGDVEGRAGSGERGAGKRRAGEALREAGIEPLVLEAKEGLAIINGTHLMASLGAIAVAESAALLRAALAACAMSIDASKASHAFLDPRVHAVRKQAGQQSVASVLRALLAGGAIAASHAENDPRVQDPYCLRCSPQVLGAAHDGLLPLRAAVEAELGAVTDNPLVFAGTGGAGHASDAIISAGNFHGMPLAIPLDSAAIAIAHIAGLSERRTFWMLGAFDPENKLPPYMARGAGLSSGLMIAQYVAAACCNEIIGLCTPASVANVSTSAGIEDYNSFGPRSGWKLLRALELARKVVAIELLCASEGLEFQRPLRSGVLVERIYDAVRERVQPLGQDRSPTPDIEAIARMMEGH